MVARLLQVLDIEECLGVWGLPWACLMVKGLVEGMGSTWTQEEKSPFLHHNPHLIKFRTLQGCGLDSPQHQSALLSQSSALIMSLSCSKTIMAPHYLENKFKLKGQILKVTAMGP